MSKYYNKPWHLLLLYDPYKSWLMWLPYAVFLLAFSLVIAYPDILRGELYSMPGAEPGHYVMFILTLIVLFVVIFFQVILSYFISPKRFIESHPKIIIAWIPLLILSAVLSVQLISIYFFSIEIVLPFRSKGPLDINQLIFFAGLSIFLLIFGIVMIKFNLDWTIICLIYTGSSITVSTILLSLGAAYMVVEDPDSLYFFLIYPLTIFIMISRPFFISWHLYFKERSLV